MNNLVIGLGEVGESLKNFLDCEGVDLGDQIEGKRDVIHICFPFEKDFFDNVKIYIEKFDPQIVIIHSTVPVGATREIGDNCVHSPIRGKHPNLEESIKTFTKFFGGPMAEEASQIFKERGVDVITTLKAENTEAMKLWDTQIYKEAILLNKKIHQYCVDNDLDFDLVYTKANETYNEGYRKMGNPEYAKYVLKYIDGPIGGHCVESNSKLLFDDEL